MPRRAERTQPTGNYKGCSSPLSLSSLHAPSCTQHERALRATTESALCGEEDEREREWGASKSGRGGGGMRGYITKVLNPEGPQSAPKFRGLRTYVYPISRAAPFSASSFPLQYSARSCLAHSIQCIFLYVLSSERAHSIRQRDRER